MSSALAFYEKEEPRGEYVLVIEGKSFEQIEEEDREGWLDMTIEEHMAYYEGQGLEHKDAMKQVAKDRGVSKRDIYAAIHT